MQGKEEGVKNSYNFAYILYRCPLTRLPEHSHIHMHFPFMLLDMIDSVRGGGGESIRDRRSSSDDTEGTADVELADLLRNEVSKSVVEKIGSEDRKIQNLEKLVPFSGSGSFQNRS